MSIIGKKTKTRGTFGSLTGVTKVDKDKKKYSRKQKHKNRDKAGE